MPRSQPAGHFASLSLVLLLASVALFASAGSISAAGAIKLSLAPIGVTGANFVLTMRPGERNDLGVRLSNYGTELVTARTFAANAYSLVNGGFGARLEGEPLDGTTAWLTYAAGDLDLAPGQTIERHFTVAVPAGTQPGEYLTTVVLQNAVATDGSAAGAAVVLNQIVRQVVAVSIDVPGPRTPELELGPATHSLVAGKSSVSVGVHNLGNVRLKPAGEFVLWDSTGKQVTEFPVSMDTVHAHTDTTAEIPFAQKLNPGEYSAELTMKDASGVSATSNKLPLTIAEAAPVPAAGADVVPAVAQTDQTPVAAAVATATTNPLSMVMLIFGAGLVLMLAAGGVLFVVTRRRRRRDT